MNEQQTKQLSKLLSYVLRHKPDEFNLTLDPEGWVPIDRLLTNLQKQGKTITKEQLNYVVVTNDKKRFTISEDNLYIRAAQGHSTTQVNIQYPQQEPPAVLYHGTATRFLDSIKKQGLIAGSRQYVHLSADKETARKVGTRHGVPIILEIETYQLTAQGHAFYLADNGVWLTAHVPVKAIKFN